MEVLARPVLGGVGEREPELCFSGLAYGLLAPRAARAFDARASSLAKLDLTFGAEAARWLAGAGLVSGNMRHALRPKTSSRISTASSGGRRLSPQNVQYRCV